MSCDIANFIITKDLDNTFVFTIKANNSTLPMEIIPASDTFVAKLIKLGDDTVATVALTKSLTVSDALNGKVSLVITADETENLVSDKGTKTDRYYLRPTYKLLIDCDTVNNGKFIAKVPEIYVD
jgi:hypothetical protein